MTYDIRPARGEDAAQLAALYNWYIEHSIVTFETAPVDAAEMRDRVSRCDDTTPWFVAVDANNAVMGYAYATHWKARAAYSDAREVTVYLREGLAGQGLGGQLYSALFSYLQQTPIHLLIAGIAQPNEGSVRLHEKFGFQHVGLFSEIGFKFGRRIDIGYWQLKLKRDLE